MSELDQAKLEQTLAAAFAPGQLPFCHDPSYRFQYSDRWLCSLSEAEQQRCPAFKKLCAAPSVAEPQEHDSASSAPLWLGGLAEVVFWVLIVGLAVGLITALSRMVLSRRVTAEAAAERPSLEPDASAPAAAPVSGDTDVTRLLDKARRAADQGDLGAAIDAAHAAAVQGLAAAGQVEVDRDRTNGDYVRQLRQDPPLQQQFKAIVGRVEVAQFGGAAPSRGSFDSVMEQVLALLRRLAVLSLLLLGASPLLACGGQKKAPEREELSPHGLYTLRRLLTEQGNKVHLRVAPLTKIDDSVGLVLVFDTGLEDSVRQYLMSWVRDGGSVVIVGSQPEIEKEAELEVRASRCGHQAKRASSDEAPLALAVLGASSLRLAPKAETTVSHRVAATCDGQPYVVTAYLDEGSVTFMPEHELLSNASLSVADNARLVAEELVGFDGTIELVGPWTGDGAQSPIQSIKGAGLMPVVLQLLALVGLLALRRGTSFGSRRDTTQLTRRAFADHVRALAATYARGGAGRLVSGHYGLLLIEQLKERVCPGQKPSLFQLAGALSRRVRRSEQDIVRILVEAKSAFEDLGEGEGINHQVILELEQLSLQAGGSA